MNKNVKPQTQHKTTNPKNRELIVRMLISTVKDTCPVRGDNAKPSHFYARLHSRYNSS